MEPTTPALARVAVERLAELFAAAPGVFLEALEGARAGAQVLSPDRLQGLSEIVQNADDAGATWVRFRLEPDALWVIHNGRPVHLRDVLALATPWLTTKRGDSQATGRFGIGLNTLQALSRVLEVYSGPYAIRLEAPSLSWIDLVPPEATGCAVRGTTVLRIPLGAGVLGSNALSQWLDRWDDSALLFCSHVGNIHVHLAEESCRTLTLTWDETAALDTNVQGHHCIVRRRRAQAQDRRTWVVYTTNVAPKQGVERARKAHSETMPLGVALPLFENDRGQIYAGLPLIETHLPGRFHAQFDPTANRQDLAETSWNEALLPFVADLWQGAVIQLFEEVPACAWNLVPLPSGDPGTPPQLASLEQSLLVRARTAFPQQVEIRAQGRLVPVAELAVEVPRLTGVVEDAEIAELAKLPAAMPRDARDAGGRWRRVLYDWQLAGAPISLPVSVETALDLFRDPDRDPVASIPLAAAAIAEDLEDQLGRLPTVVLEDGSRTPPPALTDPWFLLDRARGLGSVLKIGRVIHPIYRADSESTQAVLQWLSDSCALLDPSDDVAILERLARAGNAGRTVPQVLSDTQVSALRDSFEAVTSESLVSLGWGVGRAIRVDAFKFDGRGRRIRLAASPTEAYLSQGIEKERDSFAIAARNTPGLVWLEPRYARVLRSPHGRAGLGPARFLRLLGAETAPRVVPHPQLQHRYTSSTKRGLSIHVEHSPPERAQAMVAKGATYTIEDLCSPDLEAVLQSIARDRGAGRRRERAVALLETLGRAWDRLADQASVTAADDYHGWNGKGATRAFWIWQAAGIPWLDDERGIPRSPAKLRVRTPGTLAVYGQDASGYLHKDLQGHRPHILATIGVAGDPDTGELVRRLYDVRNRPSVDEEVAAEAAAIYRALSDRLGDATQLPGDLSMSQLLKAFSQPPGLIRTDLGWKRPVEVLSGDPIFGQRRAFVPGLRDMRRLWTTLRVQAPSLDDCVSVLEEMGTERKPPDPEDVMVMLESLRFLASHSTSAEKGRDVEHKLARLPLWTSRGWTRSRPVFVVDDLPLADGLGAVVPVWTPGGEVAQFKNLIAPLRMKPITAEAAVVVDEASAVHDPEVTEILRTAIGLLKDDLVRNEPAVAARIQTEWDQLSRFEVRVSAKLRVRIEGLGRRDDLTVDVSAKADRRAGVLYLRDAQDLFRVDGGGRAIASLFGGDPRRLAQAWLAACAEARAGRVAAPIRLAAERAAADRHAIQAQIAHLQSRIASGLMKGQRPGRSPAFGGTVSPESVTGPGVAPSPPTAKPNPRTLIDPTKFRVTNPLGIRANADGPDTRTLKRPPTPTLAAPKPGVPEPRPVSPPAAYTAAEREKVGLDLLRTLLASDAEGVRDLRAQRGVGADAMDLDNRYYELKVYSGLEPDYITLEASQVARALSPEFFLVVISNVEVGDATPAIRIIVNPLAQLQVADRSSVSLMGVRTAQSLVYRFERDSTTE